MCGTGRRWVWCHCAPLTGWCRYQRRSGTIAMAATRRFATDRRAWTQVVGVVAGVVTGKVAAVMSRFGDFRPDAPEVITPPAHADRHPLILVDRRAKLCTSRRHRRPSVRSSRHLAPSPRRLRTASSTPLTSAASCRCSSSTPHAPRATVDHLVRPTQPVPGARVAG